MLYSIKVSHKGNTKLGKNISTLSREVGPTCPNTCSHLGTNCYAERLQKRFPNVKRAAQQNNNITDYKEILQFLIDAKEKNNAVRLHVLGDFLKTDTIGRKILDIKYINAIKTAMSKISDPPKIWCYTHVLKPELSDLQNYGINIYASIDSDEDYKIAQQAGFKLFAFKTPYNKSDKTKYFLHENKKLPICPEQNGLQESCESCKICINGISSLGFLNH